MRRRGFTVIELMIAVIIIGTLAGIFLLSAASSTVNASTSRIIGEFKTLKKGVLLYASENGNSLPTDIEELKVYFDRDISSSLADYELEYSEDNVLWLKAGVKDGSIRKKLAMDNEAKGLSLFEEPDGCTPYSGAGPFYTVLANSRNLSGCSVSLSPLGNDFFEIINGMSRRIRELKDGKAPTWGDDGEQYKAIGLDPDFWEGGIEGIIYTPHGQHIKIEPAKDFEIKFKYGKDAGDKAGKEKTLKFENGWIIWIDTKDGKGWYGGKNGGDPVDLGSLEIVPK